MISHDDATSRTGSNIHGAHSSAYSAAADETSSGVQFAFKHLPMAAVNASLVHMHARSVLVASTR